MTPTRLKGALVLLVVTHLGCGALFGNGSVRSVSQGGRFTHAECARYQDDDARVPDVSRRYKDGDLFLAGRRRTRLTPVEGAVFLTCLDVIELDTYEPSEQAIAQDHLTFDDRHFDHLRAADMVLECALNDYCSAKFFRDVLGMMASYARRLDPAKAAAALAQAGVSAELQGAFATKVKWAQAVIHRRVTELDPRRQHIWVDIPEQVWRERAEYFARHRALYAELDPLLARVDAGTGDSTQLATELRALRERYLGGCAAQGCLFTPFVLETTRALTLLAVREGNVPEALAEAELLDDSRLLVQWFSRAMLAALLPVTRHEARQWEKYDEARRDGADAASLKAMFGRVAPIKIDPDVPLKAWGRRELPDLTASLPQGDVLEAGGKVRAIEREGERAKVIFADVVHTHRDADCHETDKVDGVSGTIVYHDADDTGDPQDADYYQKVTYRKECKNWRTVENHTEVPAIWVPATEAEALRPGDVVTAWVSRDTRSGAIVHCQREGMLVQVRGHRLRVEEAPGPDVHGPP